MTSHRARQWVTLLIFALASSVESRRPPWLRSTNPSGDFVCSRVLTDGEVERRIQRGRISAIETTVELILNPTETYSTTGHTHEVQVLTLLQVTDGRHFIQLIYDSGWDLRDCEYLKSPKSVDDFYEAFSADINCPHQKMQSLNESLNLTPEDNFSNNLRRPDVTDYATLRKECKNLHKRVKEMTMHNNHHDLQRLKRDLFLYPGTNWCGSGSNARKFNELGYNAAADRCCRDHDHCPYTIEGFTNKFNFFNFRFHTISHCDCDERFRACLKLSGTAAGNMVGKLFFNVVQTKCFLFQHVKKCAKRSWWGKCLKFEKDKSAFLREALKY